jgi:sarcosine oxidase
VNTDAVVVGLGGIGSAALQHLAARGLRAIGIEQADVPNDRGSSHGASRAIRLAYFEDPRYVPLLRAAWSMWEALDASVRESLLVRTGCLNLGAPDHPCIRGVERAVAEHGLPHERLDAAAIAARFPALRPAAGDVGVYEQQAGVLNPERCVTAQVLAAVRAGAEVRGRERVVAIEPGPDSVVVTTDRDRYDAGVCVVATGAWLAAEDSPVRIEIPLAVERQVQLWFQPIDPAPFEVGRMPVAIRFDGDASFYAMPRLEHPGVKVCRHHGGSMTTAADLDRTPTRADEDDVRAFVRAHMPGADGPLVAARVCMYTNTPDQHAVIGRHPAHERVYLCGGFSGHGFKLAPVVGEIVADLATAGETKHSIDLFDPGRSET